jgi:hypothetical protein
VVSNVDVRFNADQLLLDFAAFSTYHFRQLIARPAQPLFNDVELGGKIFALSMLIPESSVKQNRGFLPPGAIIL